MARVVIHVFQTRFPYPVSTFREHLPVPPPACVDGKDAGNPLRVFKLDSRMKLDFPNRVVQKDERVKLPRVCIIDTVAAADAVRGKAVVS